MHFTITFCAISAPVLQKKKKTDIATKTLHQFSGI